MAKRLTALILLLAIGLLLPTAGMPHRFCTLTRTLISDPTSCKACSEKSCCQGHIPAGEPDCVMIVKNLPDGVHWDSPATLALPVFTLSDPNPMLPEPLLVETTGIAGTTSHGPAPPDPLPLYLTKRSLLL